MEQLNLEFLNINSKGLLEGKPRRRSGLIPTRVAARNQYPGNDKLRSSSDGTFFEAPNEGEKLVLAIDCR